ncbi:GNAT family N-acetyltransferase [Spirosoma harenae]
MITYRSATSADAEPIAQLHSLSWQQNYRGIWSDDFLNGPVSENRRTVWQQRLQQPTPDQYVVVAESDNKLCGFVCAYSDEHPVWGTLLDNLHVHKNQQGQGIGGELVRSAARWSFDQFPKMGLYLWVLVDNTRAQKVYDALGGVNHELVSMPNPDGSFSDCYRYVWTDIKTLV